MKINPPKNENYAATVVTIRSLVPLENCDNVVAAPLLGYQAIVSKDTKIGDVGILFTAETQLSEEYASTNNLFRHTDRNLDPTQKGYLEDNRRVKALKFRGHRSDALFMPLQSLWYTGQDFGGSLPDNTSFDELNGREICNKYVIPTRGGSNVRIAPATRVDDKFFPKHFDTSNFFKNIHLIDPKQTVVITQKLHGTSIRIGHVPVSRKLSWVERLASKFGAKIQEYDYDYVYGSRNVTKDPNDPDLPEDFYGGDIYTEEGKKLAGYIPKGFMVYGELVGWASPGKPIQGGYTYGHAPGTRSLYVYRVSQVNADGREVDLSWDQVVEFCETVGLLVVPVVQSEYFHTREFLQEHIEWLIEYWAGVSHRPDILPTENPNEGVVIRQDGLHPLVLKAKSAEFLRFESKQKDKEIVSMEDEG